MSAATSVLQAVSHSPQTQTDTTGITNRAEKIDSFLPTDTDPRSSLHFVDDFWAQADLQGFTHKEILPGTIIQLSGEFERFDIDLEG